MLQIALETRVIFWFRTNRVKRFKWSVLSYVPSPIHKYSIIMLKFFFVTSLFILKPNVIFLSQQKFLINFMMNKDKSYRNILTFFFIFITISLTKNITNLVNIWKLSFSCKRSSLSCVFHNKPKGTDAPKWSKQSVMCYHK